MGMGPPFYTHFLFCAPELICIGRNQEEDRVLGNDVETILRDFLSYLHQRIWSLLTCRSE